MRPTVVGGALPSSPRKQSVGDHDATTPVATAANGGPTTFFMTSESMLEALEPTAAASGSDSNYGIRSLEESPESIEAVNPDAEQELVDNQGKYSGRRRSTVKARDQGNREQSTDSQGLLSSSTSPETSPARVRKRRRRPDPESQPLTPLSFTSPVLGPSTPGSPKSVSTRSLRQSDDEALSDGGSQAIASSGEDDAENLSESQRTAPQLIMPSIMMPRRRPFTERGKALGRLKILLAGPSGVGKTSLIKSIVQLCEDIVHVDQIASASPILKQLALKSLKRSSKSSNPTYHVTEIYASTKSYPSWWSEFEESTILKRRRSGGDTVLERNVCFVDTPGHGSGTSAMEDMNPVFRYLEGQMNKSLSISDMSDTDRLGILGGNGGSHVDLVLYMTQQSLQPVDVEFLKQLSRMTNVVPLIAKSDLMSADDIAPLKCSIHQDLQTTGLKTFNFHPEQSERSAIYTVCSSRSSDEDNMDASLLMSPDYVQPLLPSELGSLLDLIFDNNHASWLKHAAAKKALQWSKAAEEMATTPSPLRTAFPLNYSRPSQSPLTPSFSSLSSASLSPVTVSQPTSALSYTQARIVDHTHREERLAQIHLANWAVNLQRSLANERARYESLARAEQAAWLKERMDQCILDESQAGNGNQALVCTSRPRPGSATGSPLSAATRCGLGGLADPLGLMRWSDLMRESGWVAVQVLGVFGVLGAAAVWVARNWEWGGLGVGCGEGFMV